MTGFSSGIRSIGRALVVVAGLVALAACTGSEAPKASRPVPYALKQDMQRLDMKETSQIFIRIFKESSELEVWKQTRSGKFALLKTYEICRWSGVLGPKLKEGDKQAPEGFYTVTPAQMNPNSSYYLSFNIGYPNTFDRSHGRTGSHLMVHGACSSAGCYSMTDEDAGELFALARDSFRGGQTSFQIQALPFRMTAANLARHNGDPNMSFWKMLKTGSDVFELTKVPPKVDVCDRRYVFNADPGGASFNASAACPAYTQPEALVAALERKKADDEAAVLALMTTADAKTKAAAEKAALAQAKQAEKERLAAERAAQPSLISRIFNRDGQAVDSEPVASVAAAPATQPAPQPAQPQVMALVPENPVPAPVPAPRLRPEGQATTALPAPAPVVAPAAVAAAPQPQPAPAEVAPADPGVGTFVKKKFLWPGEEEEGAL